MVQSFTLTSLTLSFYNFGSKTLWHKGGKICVLTQTSHLYATVGIKSAFQTRTNIQVRASNHVNAWLKTVSEGRRDNRPLLERRALCSSSQPLPFVPRFQSNKTAEEDKCECKITRVLLDIRGGRASARSRIMDGGRGIAAPMRWSRNIGTRGRDNAENKKCQIFLLCHSKATYSTLCTLKIFIHGCTAKKPIHY